MDIYKNSIQIQFCRSTLKPQCVLYNGLPYIKITKVRVTSRRSYWLWGSVVRTGKGGKYDRREISDGSAANETLFGGFSNEKHKDNMRSSRGNSQKKRQPPFIYVYIFCNIFIHIGKTWGKCGAT